MIETKSALVRCGPQPPLHPRDFVRPSPQGMDRVRKRYDWYCVSLDPREITLQAAKGRSKERPRCDSRIAFLEKEMDKLVSELAFERMKRQHLANYEGADKFVIALNVSKLDKRLRGDGYYI